MMNRAEFENIARHEDRFWWFRGMARSLFAMLDPMVRGGRTWRVLETGCGTGFFARRLQERYHWTLFPSDLDSEGLRYGRDLGVPRLCQADAAHLPYKDGSFDAAFSLDVIVHFPRGSEHEPVAELSRVLKRGGLLVIRVAALDILRSRHSEFTHERQRFTRECLTRLAARHGIRVLRCTYANSLLLPIALLKFRIVEPLLRRPASSGVAQLPAALNALLEFPLRLESLWFKAGGNLPAGQSLILIGERA